MSLAGPRLFVCWLLLTCGAFAQPADITGWQKLPWGTKKQEAFRTLQPLHVHEGPDGLTIDAYRLNGVSYAVTLFSSPSDGLQRILMTAADEKGAMGKALAELTAVYGKPEFQSAFDGDEETIQTRWTWVKPHGKVSLESADGVFTITYSVRSGRERK